MFRFGCILVSLSIAVAAGADVITLANGDELSGEIVDWAVDHVVIDHEQLGRIRLELDQLKIDTGTEPSPGIFDTGFLRGWKRRINVGWNGRQGDETRSNVTAGLEFSYADPFKRWRVNGRYFFQTSTDDDPDNNARLDVSRDWLFPSNDWFARASLRYQFDEFEAWQHRTIFSAGPGYRLFRTESHELDLVLAPAFTREYGDVDENRSELLLDANYRWSIWREISFSLDNQLFTRLTPDAGEIRNFTIASLQIPLLQKPDLDLSLKIENEYDSLPDPGDKENDLLYFFTFGLGF